MIASRATAENAMFWAERRLLAQMMMAEPSSPGVVERPLERLHAAERSADRRQRPLDAQMGHQRPLHRAPGRGP